MDTFMMLECADGSARATPDDVRMLAQLYELGDVRAHDLFNSWIRVARVTMTDVYMVADAHGKLIPENIPK